MKSSHTGANGLPDSSFPNRSISSPPCRAIRRERCCVASCAHPTGRGTKDRLAEASRSGRALRQFVERLKPCDQCGHVEQRDHVRTITRRLDGIGVSFEEHRRRAYCQCSTRQDRRELSLTSVL